MFNLLVGIGLMTAQASEAAPRSYYHRDHWFVTKSYKSCTLFATFKNDLVFWINYRPLDKKALVAVTGSNFESIDEGDAFLVGVDFVDGDRFSKRYPVQSFEGTRRLTYPGIERKFEAAEFLSLTKNSEILAFSLNDGTIVASLSLRGSAEAVTALENCAKKEAGINPNDPFAGAEIPKMPARN